MILRMLSERYPYVHLVFIRELSPENIPGLEIYFQAQIRQSQCLNSVLNVGTIVSSYYCILNAHIYD